MTKVNIPEGYIQINDIDPIYINKEGKVFNSRTGNISDAHSYSTVVIHSYSVDGCEKSFQLSRAIAKNFVPIPRLMSGIPIEKLNVKFKDGDKCNINADNLYWDYSNKCSPIKVILPDGSTKLYTSVEDAWRVHGTAKYSAFSAAVRKGCLKKAGLRFEVLD